MVGRLPVGGLPLNGRGWSSQFQAENWPPERVGLNIVHRRANAVYIEAVQTPLIPIARTRTLRDVWSQSMAREEFVLTLLMVFGIVALLLAAVRVRHRCFE